MNNFISRLFVVCLLFSVVTEVSAQDRNIDKSGAKQEIKQGKDKVKKGNAGSSARVDSDTRSGNSNDGVKSKAKNPGTKLGPGGSSARLGSDTAGPKSGKTAKKGFLGRLFSRSSKKSKSAKAAGSDKAAGASQPVGKGIDDNAETDPRDKP